MSLKGDDAHSCSHQGKAEVCLTFWVPRGKVTAVKVWRNSGALQAGSWG